MDFIEEGTCIKFQNKDRMTTDYVLFADGDKCESDVGYQGKQQEITLDVKEGCYFDQTIAHEIMHTLGVYHEQSRPDRDEYVKVVYDNIKSGATYNFRKRSERGRMIRPFDFNSTMLYSPNNHSKDSSKYTMKSILLGKSMKFWWDKPSPLSLGDIYTLSKLYPCSPYNHDKNYNAYRQYWDSLVDDKVARKYLKENLKYHGSYSVEAFTHQVLKILHERYNLYSSDF